MDNIKLCVGCCKTDSSYQYKSIVLKNGLSFASQVVEEYRKYIIKWDFDLNGETITIPENCILEFDGGSVKNGTLIGQETVFNNIGDLDTIFGEDLIKQGTWIDHFANGGGQPGPKGDDGDSAYEVAVKNGFVGTEEEWLASLKGEKGDTGPQGPQGEPGTLVNQKQADWNQQDPNEKDYIKNKPTIPAAVTVDSQLSKISENPVQNKVITEVLEDIKDGVDKDYDPTDFSGMGKVYLKKNIVNVGGVDKNLLTQDAFYKDDGNGGRIPNTNTIFVVEYDFVLGNSEIYDISFAAENIIRMTSARRPIVITELNSAQTAVVGGTTYYYLEIPLAKNRTFTLLDTTNCKLLAGTKDSQGNVTITGLLGNNTVVAGENGGTVYVGTQVENTYTEAYTISVPYYYKPVQVPANHRIEILDYTHCLFLTDEKDNLSWYRGLETSDSDYTVYIASDEIGSYSNIYRITEIPNIEIPDNCVIEFDGGSFTDGNIIGCNTRIIADNKPIFANVVISNKIVEEEQEIDGQTVNVVVENNRWLVPNIYSAWFSEAGTIDNAIAQIENLCSPDIHNNVYIDEGTYWVTPFGSPSINQFVVSLCSDHTTIHLNGELRLRTNNCTSISPFGLYMKEDVTIKGGGSIYGDKPTHIYSDWNTYPDGWFRTYVRRIDDPNNPGEYISIDSTHEGCECVHLLYSHHITIDNIHCYDAVGDGILVNESTTQNTKDAGKIIIRNCSTYNTRRQGISVCNDNVIIENCHIEKVYGTAPASGIDVEPPSTVFNSRVIIRNVYIKDTCQGIVVECLDYNNPMAEVLVDNCVVENSNCPLGVTHNTRNVTISNSKFIARNGKWPHIRTYILSWDDSNYYSGVTGINSRVINCEFTLAEGVTNTNKYLLGCVTSRTAQKYFRVEISSCFFYAPDTNGIKISGYPCNFNNNIVKAKSFICTNTPDNIVNVKANKFELGFAKFDYAKVSGNDIIMTGPILCGSLEGNKIAFNNLPNTYTELFATYEISGYTGKFLIASVETTSIEGNRIQVQSAFSQEHPLDGLFFIGASWNRSGAKANIINNYFCSQSNLSNYVDLSAIPVATKGNYDYYFAYCFNNVFNGLPLENIQLSYEVLGEYEKVNQWHTDAYGYIQSYFGYTREEAYMLSVDGDTPDRIVFESETGNLVYPWSEGVWYIGNSGTLELVWDDDYHPDTKLIVKRCSLCKTLPAYNTKEVITPENIYI